MRPQRRSKAKQNLRALIRKCNEGASTHRDKEPTPVQEEVVIESSSGVLSSDSKGGETSLRCKHCPYETRLLKRSKAKQIRDHLKGCKGDKIDVEQPRMLEAAVSHPVEGTLSTEGASPTAAQEDHILEAPQVPTYADVAGAPPNLDPEEAAPQPATGDVIGAGNTPRRSARVSRPPKRYIAEC